MFPQTSNLVDMFPLTRMGETGRKSINLIASTHVETICLFSQLRQKPNDYIGVDIDAAEMEEK